MALGPDGKGRDCKSQARKYSVRLREAPPKYGRLVQWENKELITLKQQIETAIGYQVWVTRLKVRQRIVNPSGKPTLGSIPR